MEISAGIYRRIFVFVLSFSILLCLVVYRHQLLEETGASIFLP